jgi:cytokinin dehydrogenase
LAPLSFIRSLLFSTDVSYFKFLNRVHDVELSLRAQQLWDVPHPWLDIFIPASSMTTFDSLVFQQLVPVEYGGPILVYPVELRIIKFQVSSIRSLTIMLLQVFFFFSNYRRRS